MKKKQRIISLGKLAIKLNITKSRLEYYEKLNFIKPLYVMTDGVRGYDEDRATKRITFVKDRQAVGMSLQEIKKELNK